MPAPAASSSSASQQPPKLPGNKAMVDFFSTIEEEQQSMFNPQTNRCVLAGFGSNGLSSRRTQPFDSLFPAAINTQSFRCPNDRCTLWRATNAAAGSTDRFPHATADCFPITATNGHKSFRHAPAAAAATTTASTPPAFPSATTNFFLAATTDWCKSFPTKYAISTCYRHVAIWDCGWDDASATTVGFESLPSAKSTSDWYWVGCRAAKSRCINNSSTHV